jgi:hypothetical protein
MKCMRAMCGISIIYGVTIVEIRRCVSELSAVERMKINLLMWYGHVERMEKEKVAKMATVEGSIRL